MVDSKCPPSETSPYERPLAFFQLLCGIFGLLLLSVTWRLWLPGGEFPKVSLLNRLPLFGSPSHWPSAVDHLALYAMIAGFIAMTFAPVLRLLKTGRKLYVCVTVAISLFAIGFTCSAIIDQHRLQPWAIQFFALSLLFAGHRENADWNQDLIPNPQTSARQRLKLARLLVLGIYFWSAASKLDYQFAYTVGSEMLSVPAGWFGVSLQPDHRDLWALAALLLPLIELIAVCLLSFRKSRTTGTILAVAMHLGLLILLGPLGLNHRPGVLLWNLFSLFQVCLLFGIGPQSSTTSLHTSMESSTNKARMPTNTPVYSTVVILLMLTLPVAERWSYYDHWPSWALYAPHSSRVTLLVPVASVPRLPESLEKLVSQPDVNTLYVDVPLDKWSLLYFGAPIYPQGRYQLAVAIAIVETAGLDREAKVILKGPADRWTGARESTELRGLHQMKQAGERYWLNASPALP